MTPGNTYFVRVYNYYGGAENTAPSTCALERLLLHPRTTNAQMRSRSSAIV